MPTLHDCVEKWKPLTEGMSPYPASVASWVMEHESVWLKANEDVRIEIGPVLRTFFPVMRRAIAVLTNDPECGEVGGLTELSPDLSAYSVAEAVRDSFGAVYEAETEADAHSFIGERIDVRFPTKDDLVKSPIAIGLAERIHGYICSCPEA